VLKKVEGIIFTRDACKGGKGLTVSFGFGEGKTTQGQE